MNKGRPIQEREDGKKDLYTLVREADRVVTF